MVGATGLEPAAPCPPCKCATRLRSAPTRMFHDTRSRLHCHGNSGKTRRLRPPEVVLQPLDVVFSHIRPGLDLDDDHVLPPDVLDPVDGPRGDVGGIARLHPDRFPLPGDYRLSPHEVPVLGSVPVSLKAQALSRAHEEPLDLASFLLVEDEVEAPWALPPFPVPGGAAIVGIPGRIHPGISARGIPGEAGLPPPSAPSRKSLGIRAPLQGAGPRKGFVARPGRPEARRASAGASAEAYGQYAAQASDQHARRSPGIACRSRKGSPFGDRRLRLRLHPPPLVRTPAAGAAHPPGARALP